MVWRQSEHRALLSVIAAVAFALISGADVAAATDESWAIIRFQGQRAGWAHEKVIEAGGRITSTSRTHLAIRRGQARVEMDFESTFTETDDGQPIEATVVTGAATGRIEKTFTFHEDHIRAVTVSGGRRTAERRPLPRDWLTPGQVDALVSRQREAGAQTMTYRTLEPSTGLDVVTVTIANDGHETIDVLGREVRALRQNVEASNMPGVPMVQYADESGATLLSTIQLGGIMLEVIAADRALAMAEVEPPELMADMLVEVGRAVADPRELRRATWRLRVTSGRLPDLPTSTAQQFERVDAQSAVIRIDLDAVASEPDPAEAPAIEHTPMIDGRDERVIALARRAVAGQPVDTTARAEAMRRFVGRYINDVSLDVAMAGAGEVARERKGDCTEHAVLLAAMLKADDIPARVASGLVYADSFIQRRRVFAYHMWTQAWVDGRWVDLDATLDATTAFDATHILINTSDLGDEALTSDLLTLVPLLGRLEIQQEANPWPRR